MNKLIDFANRVTQLLVIALVLSLGFGQLLRFSFYGVPLYLHDILVLCILALQGLTLKAEPNPQTQRREGQTLKVFAVGLSIGWLHALSLFPLSSLLIPSLYTLRLLAYLSLYLLLNRNKFIISNSYFLISGLVTLVIGYLQYFLLPDMRIFQYLGWDDHLSRLTLPHFDPTFTAVMIGLALLSTVSITTSFLIPVFYFLAILLTYSRSVWLSLAFTLGFFIRPKKYLFFLIPILLISIYSLPKRFGEGTNLLRTYSISSRLQSDIAYIQKYNWDLLIGRGMNTLILDSPSSDLPNHATGPNNSYLYLLATTGVIGLVGWGMFMLSLYRKSLHKPMLVFFFVDSLFNNVMFYPFALLWVLLIESTVPTSA